MKIEFRKTFEKDLRKLRDKNLKLRIKETIQAVEESESLEQLMNLKKLKGEDGYFRIRIGDYRIGLFVTQATASFVRILHRREFYRYFP